MLNTEMEMRMKFNRIQNYLNLPEVEIQSIKKNLINKLFMRHISKPIGRGMLLYGTQQILATEKAKMPIINN